MFIALFVFVVVLIGVQYIQISRLEKTLSRQQKEVEMLKQRIVDIDPQFDDERVLMTGFNEAMAKGEVTLLGSAHADLMRKKELEGKPTLFEPFRNND